MWQSSQLLLSSLVLSQAGDFATEITRGQVGFPRRDPYTGMIQNHHLPSTDVTRERANVYSLKVPATAPANAWRSTSSDTTQKDWCSPTIIHLTFSCKYCFLSSCDATLVSRVDGRYTQVPRRTGVRARTPPARRTTGKAARETGSASGQFTSVSFLLLIFLFLRLKYQRQLIS